MWNKCPNITLRQNNTNPPPLPPRPNNLPLKFCIQYSYYTNKSFFPPEEITSNVWYTEITSCGIYNAYKDLEISKRLSSLQNIFTCKLTTKLNTIIYNNSTSFHKSFHSFIDSLNSIYLIKTQIKHPTLYNNHLDKEIWLEIITLLCSIQPPTIYKDRAHSRI